MNINRVSSIVLLPLSLFVSIATTGCTQNSDSARVEALEKRLSAVEATVGQLKNTERAELPKAEVVSTVITASSDAANAASTISPVANTQAGSGSFSDIKGVFGEKEINALSRLGVTDTTKGSFEPHKPISRREFLRWMVKANNTIFKPMRLAESGDSSFPDFSSKDPDFKYIQGLANAGYVIGYEDKTLRPEQALTREEMIGLKLPVDYVGMWAQNADIRAVERHGFTNDAKEVSNKFYPQFEMDTYSAADNITRVFGSSKAFHPHQAVTRAEAAVCLWQFGGHSSECGAYNPDKRFVQ